MKEQQRVGGSLERALQDNHQFNPVDVLKEAFNTTKSTFASIVGAVVLALAVFFVVLLLALQLFVGAPDIEDSRTVMVVMLVQTLVVPPLFAAVHVMGMMHAVGKRTQVSDVFRFVRQPFNFILIALITQIINQLVAGVLPTILSLAVLGFVAVTLSMAVPLAAEYRLSPIEAIRCSFIAVIKRFASFLLVYAIMFALFLLGLFTFGLAWIFIVPMFYNVKGIMYRDVFGIAIDSDADDMQINSESTRQPQAQKPDDNGRWDA